MREADEVCATVGMEEPSEYKQNTRSVVWQYGAWETGMSPTDIIREADGSLLTEYQARGVILSVLTSRYHS